MDNYFASLDECVEFWAEKTPNKIFISDNTSESPNEITYQKADERISRYAKVISQIDCQRIGVSLATDIDTVCLFYSVIRAGKDVVLLDPCWGEFTLKNIIRVAEISVVIGKSAIEHDVLSELYCSLELSDIDSLAICRSRGELSKLLIFTSGTTSNPKGIVLSQDAMLYAYSIGVSALGLESAVRVGCFYRVSGLGILGINFLFPHTIGGTCIILPEYAYFDIKDFWATVEELNISFIYIVPPIVSYLVKASAALELNRLDNVLCVAGSAKLDSAVQSKFQEKFSKLANIYGLSECGFAVLFGHEINGLFNNSVGLPLGIEVRILDENSKIIEAADNLGTLYVKTKSLFDGYLNSDELTREIVCDGWINTKDIAFYDELGCVCIVGRSNDTINKGGNLFHISEAEECILLFAGVVEVVCVKISCDIYGEDYFAVVRSEKLSDDISLRDYLSTQLGHVRAPKEIIIISHEIPRNGAGKYDRNQLLELCSQIQ